MTISQTVLEKGARYYRTGRAVSIDYSSHPSTVKTARMSSLAENRPGEDIVLVFRPPEGAAAQIAGITPFKSLRLRLDELLDWFKGLNVDSIDLWIEGAWKSGNRTELFLSVEGRTGAKLTLKPFSQRGQTSPPPTKVEGHSVSDQEKPASQDSPGQKLTQERTSTEPSSSSVTALYSPGGGIERHVVSLINSAISGIEMAAYAFTNIFIEKALLEAIKRGVKVELVLDRSETQGQQATLHDSLEKAGADIRLISPPGGIMHDKYMIVDGKTLEWGSYNYTERAENSNFENATFASDGSLAQQYHSDFLSMFNQAKPEVRGFRRGMTRFFRSLMPRLNE